MVIKNKTPKAMPQPMPEETAMPPAIEEASQPLPEEAPMATPVETASVDTPAVCPMCGAKFFVKSNLDLHKTKHEK